MEILLVVVIVSLFGTFMTLGAYDAQERIKLEEASDQKSKVSSYSKKKADGVK